MSASSYWPACCGCARATPAATMDAPSHAANRHALPVLTYFPPGFRSLAATDVITGGARPPIAHRSYFLSNTSVFPTPAAAPVPIVVTVITLPSAETSLVDV